MRLEKESRSVPDKISDVVKIRQTKYKSSLYHEILIYIYI